MKRFPLGIALSAILLGSTYTAMADNAFSDVAQDHWSYKAVSELSDAGVVVGYPDGTFKGDKKITRYEVAQIVGRLMANEDSLTEEQKVTVKKLEEQYADELKNLGVRVNALEKKVFDNTFFLYDMRVSTMPIYDNIFNKDEHKETSLGVRFRVNSFTEMTKRFWMYGQLETHASMNGNAFNGDNTTDADDSKFKLSRFFVSYHFGDMKDKYYMNTGPTDDNLIIGRYPMKLGMTGYTYNGELTGVGVIFGDHYTGGALRIGTGRANNINYDYTGPMMHGIKYMKQSAAALAGSLAAQKFIESGQNPAQAKALGGVISKAIANTTDKAHLQQNIANALKPHIGDTRAQGVAQSLVAQFQTSERLKTLDKGLDWSNGRYYPMMQQGVHMADGEDVDVPLTFISYKYVNPKNYEFHIYGAKANGPVGNIVKAWGSAVSLNVNNHVELHGEYLKNMRLLPLNNERPHSFNFGFTIGKANIMEPHSYAFTLDHVYSEAGTYFGGSSSDVADQYMGHVYKNWTFNGVNMGKMPAYIADKMDAVASNTDHPGRKYGGAKFNIARFEYIPMRGVRLKAEYGFGAKDMGGRKMDNVLYLEAQAYFK